MKKENICSPDNESLQHEIDSVLNVLQSKERYRKIINAGIARWVKDFQDGRIEIKTVEDLKKLIEIDLALQKEED
ncbi:hypothetical protein P6709_02110 [Jeotgalibacillus sp. ET6]|uniref:hypothetical protein n=1 Tax=Jeotgalibacillus sp. ET6 TaxID=3037260 RepID=UPI0024182683|nr:hypothetical protein [Jeotgalibacillus sp. ET6]MDG5470524.1 hypothetical protein [Jeotgalibacillus sp. ET6]